MRSKTPCSALAGLRDRVKSQVGPRLPRPRWDGLPLVAHQFVAAVHPSPSWGGQQPRAAIARAVLSPPKSFLADEPMENLDTANGEEVMQPLTELNAEGTTLVMGAHSHSHAESAHRIVNLFDGAIVTEYIRQVL